MTICNIEVSLFPCESALSKYAIKPATIIFEKRRILAWRVTNTIIYVCHIYMYIYIYIYTIIVCLYVCKILL